MAKVADVRLGWKKSVSADVTKVTVVVTADGTDTTTEVGKEIESFDIVVAAGKTISFKVVTEDSEGLVSTSVSYSFTLSDLEAPQPATALFHTVVAIRDVDG